MIEHRDPVLHSTGSRLSEFRGLSPEEIRELLLEQAIASGQVSARQIEAHIKAGDLPGREKAA